MRFGWLTLAHSPSPEDDFKAIEQQLSQACYAEEMGFDDVWLTEHYFTGESVYNDPIPFASALAMRTSRVRIGFAVIQMSLHHPVRLAVQLSVLDNLSRGRLDVGVGRGTIFNEYEFVGYGLRSDDSRARMDEGLEILTRAWTQTPFSYEGTYYQLTIPELRPRPYQSPHPPIWRSAVSPDSFLECGRLGVPIMTIRMPLERIPERLKLYAEGLEAGGHNAETAERLLQQAAVWRNVYVAESHAQAEDTLVESLRTTRHHMVHARTAFNPGDFQVDPMLLNPWSDSAVSDEDGIRYVLDTGSIYGSPQQVAEQMAALRDAGAHHVMCQMSFGGMSHERICESMRRFGSEVIPGLRSAPTQV